MKKNENRSGYKKTKVGWIPEDWATSSLGRHIDLLKGFPFTSDSYTESESSIRLLRGDNVVQGALRWESAKRWPQGNVDKLTEYQLRSGDLVIAMDRTWVKAVQTETAVPHISSKQIDEFPIPLPPSPSRRRSRGCWSVGIMRFGGMGRR